MAGADRDTKCSEEIANIFGGNVCPFKIIELSVLKDIKSVFFKVSNLSLDGK